MICPECNRKFEGASGVCPRCGARKGVIKSSTILISSGETRTVYRSVEDVPDPLKRQLLRSTNGLNSATIVIADREGRKEIAKAIRNLPAAGEKPTPGPVAAPDGKLPLAVVRSGCGFPSAAVQFICHCPLSNRQFVAPWDMRHAVEKCRDAGNTQVFLTERGSSFGYNNLVVDMRSLAIMRKFAPVVFDATHSVQLPSAQATDNGPAVSGGQPEFIPLLARAAVAAGVDGVFMEVHDNPKEAKSDGANALESTKLRGVLKELQAIREALDVARETP